MHSNARFHKDKITRKVMTRFYPVIANTRVKIDGLKKVQTINKGAFCICVLQ